MNKDLYTGDAPSALEKVVFHPCTDKKEEYCKWMIFNQSENQHHMEDAWVFDLHLSD